jgi:hypothetical protein
MTDDELKTIVAIEKAMDSGAKAIAMDVHAVGLDVGRVFNREAVLSPAKGKFISVRVIVSEYVSPEYDQD